MPRLNRRSKVVSIRLSGKEYEELLNLCIAKGADSISELARRAMKLLVHQEDGNGAAPIESRVDEIHVRMSLMDREIGRLSSLMGIRRLELDPPHTGASLHTMSDPV